MTTTPPKTDAEQPTAGPGTETYTTVIYKIGWSSRPLTQREKWIRESALRESMRPVKP